MLCATATTMAEVLFRAKLQRESGAAAAAADTPWGFRLQGGVDYDKPLTLLKVRVRTYVINVALTYYCLQGNAAVLVMYEYMTSFSLWKF